MPRPSSPVHAKASTRCSYLTLENPHHQRQPCIKTALLQVWTIISARYDLYVTHDRPFQNLGKTHAPRHRLKNPFTMSKNARQILAIQSRRTGNRFASSLEYLLERQCNALYHPQAALTAKMVEPIAIEPMTLCLQSNRSPS